MSAPEFADSLLPGLAPLNVGDPAVLGAGRANYRTADPERLRALKEATMAERPDAEFMAFLNSVWVGGRTARQVSRSAYKQCAEQTHRGG
ncbi:hypothetical protein ACIG56_33165 [Nocardia fusca]|uniref:hypothetical protein n=1 Tax=Nocardia fusca TaxID=941183 RepID=UPI0037C8C203